MKPSELKPCEALTNTLVLNHEALCKIVADYLNDELSMGVNVTDIVQVGEDFEVKMHGSDVIG